MSLGLSPVGLRPVGLGPATTAAPALGPAVCLDVGELTWRAAPGASDRRVFLSAAGGLYAATSGQAGDRAVSLASGALSAS